MKSLYESIIGSNSVGIYSKLRYLFHNAYTYRKSNELNELWNKIGLGIDGYHWNYNPTGIYYENSEYPGNIIIIARVIKNINSKYDIGIYKSGAGEAGGTAAAELIKKLKSKEKIIIDDPGDHDSYFVKFP